MSVGKIEMDQLHLRVGHGAQAFEAVRDISLTVQPGEFVCLLGPSGCGKSTLLGALAGHLRPSRGAITVDGRAIDGPHAERGLVFQHHTLFPWRKVVDSIIEQIVVPFARARDASLVTSPAFTELKRHCLQLLHPATAGLPLARLSPLGAPTLRDLQFAI